MQSVPLADAIRPQTLDEVVGQKHLLSEGRVLRTIIESGKIPNMIFYGPSGVGKTTVASIIAQRTNKRLYKLNGTSASVSDIKDIVASLDGFDSQQGVLLYLDEIQYLNKKQQQSLLEYIENGKITLIASTTENPHFYVYNAVLSRSTVFEFKPVTPDEVEDAVERGFKKAGEQLNAEIEIEDGVVAFIARHCGGDVRKAVNCIELSVLSAPMNAEGKAAVSLESVKELCQRSSMKYDRDGDEHYDILSAFQKSIRGSDENAALHYLARLLTAGDMLSPCRRLLVIASEDVGLAYPQAVSIVKSCVDSALQLGLPEARLPLAEATLLLATAPKSNSVIMAIDEAMADIAAGDAVDVPSHLRDTHYPGAEKLGRGGYKYAHSYENHYVKQQYLPDRLKDRVYYHFGDNKNEQAAAKYWQEIKNKK
ncbi:MAG: replication-associated recombination protein A [Oscillospiraceae bacterium]|nr:replication-associated recombination protein A [Oscillospiraceae bacterium]